MILEKQKQSLIIDEGQSQDTIKMGLDLESSQFLMQILSKNLYSDAIGSTVRETASNALDSHRRAKINEPIIVSLKAENNGNYLFSVEDFGTGLDDKDVSEIISKYGKSTKRETNEELGLMGLGFKSPLSYCSSFHFTVRKDGMERKYMMYEGEDVNTIDLLYESPTSERDGTKVLVPVAYRDRGSFLSSIKQQLAYFENVYFDVDVYGQTIQNNFSIYRAEDFQISELSSDGYMHICLDNVYYPIDYNKLGIDMINIPIGLKFGLGDGIFPTPNRESIRYTQEAKDIILEKITKVADYFVNKYNESVKSTDDIFNIFEYFSTSYRFCYINTKAYTINDLFPYSKHSIKFPTIDKVSLLNLADLYNSRYRILEEYETKYVIDKGMFRGISSTRSYRKEISVNFIKQSKIYIFSNPISKNKKEYMKDINMYNSPRPIFVKKVRNFHLFKKSKYSDYSSYYDLLKLNKYHKSQWRQVIKEFQYVMSLITKDFIDLDKIDIPKTWLDNRKVQRVTQTEGRKPKLKGEVIGKIANRLERYVEGQQCKFVPTRYNLGDIHKNPRLIIYNTHSDKSELDSIYQIIQSQKIELATFSDREVKVLEGCDVHNLISYKEFMKGKCKPFRRIVTAYLIKKMVDDYKYVFNRRDNLKSISGSLFKKLEMLYKYQGNNYTYSDNNVYKSMVEVAEVNNLYDENIYYIYKEINEFLAKFSFLNNILRDMSDNYNIPDLTKTIIINLFKYHKFRIDYHNYKLNGELITNIKN